ncbi:hypothetical protein P8S55_08695 [Halomonas sp. M1]|uniref:hypothetical protein n=1 Tax=Halomonas sp. GFAJ-1 TaxID=1118153 RepID=UPI0002D2E157|nr:hypothetical protein P8S55_08695 [Halomonas sp. M1]
MMKKDSLKKLGILGVSFGLMASPLAFAGMEGNDEYEPTPQEETMQDDQGSFNSYDTEHEHDATTEFEEEEQEFTYEEDDEQDQWETEEEDDTAW